MTCRTIRHYRGCACHEARRDAEIAGLREERDGLRRDWLDAANERDKHRTLCDRWHGEAMKLRARVVELEKPRWVAMSYGEQALVRDGVFVAWVEPIPEGRWGWSVVDGGIDGGPDGDIVGTEADAKRAAEKALGVTT